MIIACLTLIGCRVSFSGISELRDGGRERRLELIFYDSNAVYQEKILSTFASQNQASFSYVLSTETVNSQLEIYQNLFARHATHPDLYEIDVIWPAILANDLIDLTPYFKNEIKEFEPEILRNFTVGGRLVALPIFVDVGVLYYRPDLLKKYGFSSPPVTWAQMDQMASVIQNGERAAGKRDFWGYVWQGGSFEGLTCNAMEWQASEGGPLFLDGRGVIHVQSASLRSALSRAVSWIGRISPPGEPYYRESDASNLWSTGNAAFMRNWISLYATSKVPTGKGTTVSIAPLPGGAGGQRGSLGGSGMGISKFSENREFAIEALRALASERSDRLRAKLTNTIPTRTAMRNDPETMAQTALPGDLSNRVIGGLISRPSVIAAGQYALVSRAYYTAVNSVLKRQQTPDEALARLEQTLRSLGGIPERP